MSKQFLNKRHGFTYVNNLFNFFKHLIVASFKIQQSTEINNSNGFLHTRLLYMFYMRWNNVCDTYGNNTHEKHMYNMCNIYMEKVTNVIHICICTCTCIHAWMFYICFSSYLTCVENCFTFHWSKQVWNMLHIFLCNGTSRKV